jgi:hypothetical protein
LPENRDKLPKKQPKKNKATSKSINFRKFKKQGRKKSPHFAPVIRGK